MRALPPRQLVEGFVNNVIRSPVVVFSKTYCPYCIRMKEMLSEAGVKDLHVIELDMRDDSSEVQDVLLRMTGARTVPRVFIGGKSVGGTADVEALINSGQLMVKLKEAGAITETIPDQTTYINFTSVAAVVVLGIVLAYVFMHRNR